LAGTEVLKVIPPLAINVDIFADALSQARDEAKKGTALNIEFAAQAKTLDAQFIILQNTFRAISTEMGAALSPAIRIVVVELVKLFGGLADGIARNKEDIKFFIETALLGLINGFAFVARALVPFEQAFKLTFNSIVGGFQIIVAAITKALNLIFSGLAKVTSFIPGVGTTFESLANVAQDATDSMLKAFESSSEGIKDSFDLQTSASLKAADKLTEISNKIIGAADAEAEAILKTADAAEKAGERRAKVRKALLDNQKRVNEAEAEEAVAQNETLATIADDAAEVERAKEEEKLLRKRDALIKENEDLAIIDDDANNARVESNKKAIIAIEKNQKLSQKARIKIEAERIKKEQELDQKRLQAASGFFSNLSSLSSTGNKSLFEIGKAAATAGAIVDGALAIQKALAAAPPPFNFALAAAVAVKTGVNIATIQATTFQPTKAQGGLTEVPGGFPNDSFPALLSSGERVVSAEQNRDLKDFLTGNDDMTALLASIDEKLGTPPQVNVSIGEKDIFDAVRDGFDDGRLISA